MKTATGISIEPIDTTRFDEFLNYLDDQLSDNGVGDTPYFAPLAQGELRLPPEKVTAFRNGLQLPVGSRGWRRAWVARSASRQLIGHVDLRSHQQRYTEHRCLLGMGVHRHHRRLGLGAALIAHAETWALANTTLEWIDLQVISGNEPAIRLYLRSGFTKIGEVPEMFKIDGRSISDTTMTKRLATGRGRCTSTLNDSAA
jgi:ribosomal protein S18 acetylase RimI-like enzyme